jgi:hypothetical protein
MGKLRTGLLAILFLLGLSLVGASAIASGDDSDHASRREQRREREKQKKEGKSENKSRHGSSGDVIDKQQDLASAMHEAASPDELRERIADVEQRIQDEDGRHESKMAELNEKQEKAESAGKRSQISKAKKAIDKENAAHETTKSKLEAEKQDLTDRLNTAEGATTTPSENQ